METKQRRLLIRLALAALWLGLGVIVFVLNRGHTLLVDNKSIEDLNLRAPDFITVKVDKIAPMEFLRNDRDIFKVGGGKHRITVEFSDGTETVLKEFHLPLKHDQYLLSIPKLINGVEPFYEVFVSNTSREREAEPEPGF
ncbi:MAG: hypothetical protein LBF78_12815 [Treponema sp.]|jgi:hypothetical protein|nr:hypothetical protein [Treponema sp.]